MEPQAIVILTLAVAGLLGGFVFWFYKNLRSQLPKGKHVEKTHNGAGSQYLVHVIFAEGLKYSAPAAWAASKSVWSAGAAWMLNFDDGRLTKDDSEIEEVVVLFDKGTTMDAKAKSWGWKSLIFSDKSKARERMIPFETRARLVLAPTNAGAKWRIMVDGEPAYGLAGYIDQVKTRNWFGKTLPMIVISARHIAELEQTGEPGIHETLHALERDYVGGADDHVNPVVWQAAAVKESASKDSVQRKARAIYASQPRSSESTAIA